MEICRCDCGLNIDRDLNASINLEHYGLDKLKHTASSAGIKANEAGRKHGV